MLAPDHRHSRAGTPYVPTPTRTVARCCGEAFIAGLGADAAYSPRSAGLTQGRLCTPCTSHQPALLPCRLDRVPAANAVGAVVIRVERVRDVPGGRCGGKHLARPPSAAARGGIGRSRRLFRSRSRGCLLGRRRFPGRHHMRRGHCRWGGAGRRWRGRLNRPLCRKAVVPGCGAELWVEALRAIPAPRAGS